MQTHERMELQIANLIANLITFTGPFSIYEQPKYKPNLNLTVTITLILTLTLIQTLILILTQILTLKPTWVDATIRSHFGCSYIEKEPNPFATVFWSKDTKY